MATDASRDGGIGERPLPLGGKSARSTLPAVYEPTANAGLWYDKFFGLWRGLRAERPLLDAPTKLEWISQVCGEKLGGSDQLAEAGARLVDLALAKSAKSRCRVFATENRFVTGLGRQHPVENGFAWHPTLGVPYLPGSSVKGLVRAWAMTGADPAPAPERLDQIFGPREQETPSCGRVIFLDALPIRPVKLDADVMTPHFANWTADEPPGDWRSPVPIPFLTVAPGAAFLFLLLPRSPVDEPLVDEAFEWLEAALRYAGAGAKTAVGYGRFAASPKETEKLERAGEERRANRVRAALRASPAGRITLQLEGKKELEIQGWLLPNLGDDSPLGAEEKRIAAKMISEQPYFAFWKKGKYQIPPDARAGGRLGEAKIRERAALVLQILASAPT